MITNCFYFISSWFLYHSIEYLVHSLGHNHRYGYHIYKIHKNHHTIHYPCNNLLSNEYRTNFIYGLYEGVVIYSPPMMIILLSLYPLVKINTFLIISSELLFIAFISDYLHSQIHLNGSWLEKYKWFQDKRKEHFIHHKYMNKNMNIMDMTMDKLNKSYK